METSKEEQLWQAATAGNLDCVRELAEDPGVDVNWADKEMKRTPLYRASGHNWPAIVEYLLRNPRTLVNQQMAEGASPFFIACQGGWKDIVILLLADPRVDVELPDDHNSSPLWMAACYGQLLIVQLLLASGRHLNPNSVSTFNDMTPAQSARWAVRQPEWGMVGDSPANRRAYGAVIGDLLDEFDRNPVQVRLRLRRLPGVREPFIGRAFALIVFLTDGFLRIRGDSHDGFSLEERFFDISSKLPLELQMVLCNRMFGSPNDIILVRDSEPGFRWLSRSST